MQSNKERFGTLLLLTLQVEGLTYRVKSIEQPANTQIYAFLVSEKVKGEHITVKP